MRAAVLDRILQRLLGDSEYAYSHIRSKLVRQGWWGKGHLDPGLRKLPLKSFERRDQADQPQLGWMQAVGQVVGRLLKVVDPLYRFRQRGTYGARHLLSRSR